MMEKWQSPHPQTIASFGLKYRVNPGQVLSQENCNHPFISRSFLHANCMQSLARSARQTNLFQIPAISIPIWNTKEELHFNYQSKNGCSIENNGDKKEIIFNCMQNATLAKRKLEPIKFYGKPREYCKSNKYVSTNTIRFLPA